MLRTIQLTTGKLKDTLPFLNFMSPGILKKGILSAKSKIKPMIKITEPAIISGIAKFFNI